LAYDYIFKLQSNNITLAIVFKAQNHLATA